VQFQGIREQLRRAFAVTLAVVLQFSPALLQAEEFTQAGAQNTAANLNNRGSDDSLEASSNSAMVAIMNLAALNIPGAFSNGYRAYGQYINSEKLDDLEAKNLRRKSSMTSIGAGLVGGTNSSSGTGGKNGGGITGTTFSRLDPSFLYKGEAAEIATEFEKRSGMKREEFLRHLGSATDSDITFQDPNLLQKVESRFEMFKAGIKNPDFKSGLEKAASMFNPSMRAEAIAKIQAFYDENRGDSGPTTTALAQNNGDSGASNPLLPVATAETAGKANVMAEANTRAPASEAAMGKSLFIGISAQNPQDTLKELLNSPSANEADSIFKKVSKKYRSLTPGLVGRVNSPTN
jgi:hypothetical protein